MFEARQKTPERTYIVIKGQMNTSKIQNNTFKHKLTLLEYLG